MASVFDTLDAMNVQPVQSNQTTQQPTAPPQTQQDSVENVDLLVPPVNESTTSFSTESAPDTASLMDVSPEAANVSGARTHLPDNGIFPPPPALDATPEEVTRHCLDKCIIVLDHMQYGRDVLAETWQHIANHPDHKDLLQPQDMGAIHKILITIAGNKFSETKEKTTARSKKAEEKEKKIEAFDSEFGALGAL